MDISSPNDKNMFKETAEGSGHSSTTMEIPSLDEIISQPPEQALKSLETFREAQKNVLQDFFKLIKEKEGDLNSDFEARTVIEMKYQEHENLLKDMYRAAIETARKDSPEVFEGIMKAKYVLASEYYSQLMTARNFNIGGLRITHNPFIDPLFETSLKIELDRMDAVDDRWQNARELLDNQVYPLGEKSVEKEALQVPELTKSNLNDVALSYRKMAEDPAFMKQVEGAKTQVIEAKPQEIKITVEKEKESTLWKYAKKGMFYLAIGGAVAAGLYFGGPYLIEWAKKLLDHLLGGGAGETAKWVNGAFETIKEGITWVGDKLGDAWRWVAGIAENTGAANQAVEEANRLLRGGSDIIPQTPGFFQEP